MNPVVKDLLLNPKPPKIPLSLVPNVVADWDVAENGNARYDLNQRAKGGNFPSVADFEANFPSRTNVTHSVANNRLTVAATVTNGNHFILQANNIHGVTPVLGRTYYLRAYVHDVAVGRVNVRLQNTKADGTTENNTSDSVSSGGSGWIQVQFTVTSVNAAPNLSAVIRLLDAAGNSSFAGAGESATISDLTFWDCTADFGLGNCPTTAEMSTILTANGDPYHEGVRSYVCNPNKQIFLCNAKQPYATDHLKMYNFAYTTASGIVRSPVPHVRFDGTDDWLGLAKANLIASGTSFAIQAWCARTSTSTTYPCYGFLTNFTTDRALTVVYDQATSTLSATITNAAGTNSSASGTFSMQVDKFYHFIISYDATEQRVRLYVNGVYQGINAVNVVMRAISFFRIGANLAGTTYGSQRQAVTTIFNKALTKDDVRNLFNARCEEFNYPRI
jgi:hypothetical protein